ncbi:MAG TPA: hypothetical protein VF555_07950 [Variovorax sp.]
MALMGCGGSRVPGDEPADFGADITVRSMIAAQQKCSAAGVPDLYECAGAPLSPAGERLAARGALDMYQLFEQGCLETAGEGQCDSLLEAAYRKAGAQQTSSP